MVNHFKGFGNTSIPGIDATSGSLGHGLGIGCGLAYLYKKNIDKKVYVVISKVNFMRVQLGRHCCSSS